MHAIVDFVAERLRAVASGRKAREMAAYMKTDMPFYGVQKPDRAIIERQAAKRFEPRTQRQYHDHVLALWKEPHREEKYLAIALARRWKGFVGPASMPLYRRLIVGGAWWDLVDEVAIHLVGRVLDSHPARIHPMVRAWIDHPDMWLRRSAIICQVACKNRTNQGMLFDFCLQRAHEREFFIRKAIGWALREHSKTDPKAVAAFLIRHRERLSPLSVREGSRRLPARLRAAIRV